MTIRQVLLDGVNADGDGTTWADTGGGTSAYTKQSGLLAAFNASSAGDIVYVKGSDTASTAALTFGGSPTLALVSNPIQVLGCKSTTTNNQGSIVTSDLIDGIRNGGAATHAYLDADVPVVKIAGLNNLLLKGGYWYGIKLISGNWMTVASQATGLVILEEASVEVQGAGDRLDVCGAIPSSVITKNARLKCDNVTSQIRFLYGYSYHYGTVIHVPATASIFGNSGAYMAGHHEFNSADLSLGGATTIFNRQAVASGLCLLNTCKFPSSWTFTGGTAAGAYRFESYGSDDTTGLTTGGSEQQVNIEDQHGVIVTETTKVRTGGADDGADGLYSLDFSTFANGTALGIAGLSTKLGAIWVAGDGTAKTLTIFFTSDSGNTRATDWLDTEVWGTVEYPDEAGTSQYNYKSSVANLLAAGSAVTDDTGSTWGAGTARDQKIEISISPDYEGYVIPTAHFAPGANAETAYFCPLTAVA